MNNMNEKIQTRHGEVIFLGRIETEDEQPEIVLELINE